MIIGFTCRHYKSLGRYWGCRKKTVQWRICVEVREHSVVWRSVVSVTNVSFEQTRLLSDWTERNNFMNWFVPFSAQLSSAVSMPAGSGTAATHSWIFGKRRRQRADGEGLLLTPERTLLVIRSWFSNLLHTENCCWGRDSRSCTVLKVALCHSLTQGRGVDSRSVTVPLNLALCC